MKDGDLTDEVELKDCLGTRFKSIIDGSIYLTQPRMIGSVLKIVCIDPKNEIFKLHNYPSYRILDNDPNGKPRKQKCSYRYKVRFLSYIQYVIWPDISITVQKCSIFFNDPSQEHEETAKLICRYLLDTKAQGVTLSPDKEKGFECYIYTYWDLSWQHRLSDDPLSSHSWTRYVLMYSGCPIIWASKIQYLIALSTTEVDYIVLSTALCKVIRIINLLE